MDIAIIGGGITGLTTALALYRVGLPCRVFEKASAYEDVGAGIMMQPNAMEIFDWLGIADRIRSAGAALDFAGFTDNRLVPIRKFSPKSTDTYEIVSIHRARLQRVLFEALPKGTVHLGKTYAKHSVVNNRVQIDFRETQTTCDLLLGADGIHSSVRSQIFPTSSTRYAGQTSWRGVTEMALPDRLRAMAVEAWGNQIRFGFSATAPEELYWFAVIKAPERQRDRPESLKEKLMEIFGAFDDLVKTIINRTPVEKIIRTDISDLRRLQAWHQDRVCLLGDAAHATTPNLGQGGCQGVEDAYYISNILHKIPDYKRAFPQFEKERRRKVDYVVRMSWQMGKMAHSRVGQAVVKMGMRWGPEKMMLKQFRQMHRIKKNFVY